LSNFGLDSEDADISFKYSALFGIQSIKREQMDSRQAELHVRTISQASPVLYGTEQAK